MLCLLCAVVMCFLVGMLTPYAVVLHCIVFEAVCQQLRAAQPQLEKKQKEAEPLENLIRRDRNRHRDEMNEAQFVISQLRIALVSEVSTAASKQRLEDR